MPTTLERAGAEGNTVCRCLHPLPRSSIFSILRQPARLWCACHSSHRALCYAVFFNGDQVSSSLSLSSLAFVAVGSPSVLFVFLLHASRPLFFAPPVLYFALCCDAMDRRFDVFPIPLSPSLLSSLRPSLPPLSPRLDSAGRMASRLTY